VNDNDDGSATPGIGVSTSIGTEKVLARFDIALDQFRKVARSTSILIVDIGKALPRS
jgi:hypothetical protein